LATSTLASKLLQTWSLPLAKASTDLEASISQSFHKLRVCHRPKASSGGKLYSSRSAALSSRLPSRLSSRLLSRLLSRLSSRLSSRLPSGLSAIVYSTGIAAKNAGSED